MHPEIRKFLEKPDKEIVSWTHDLEHAHFYNEGLHTSIYIGDSNVLAWGEPNDLKYKLNDKWYAEEEMLKIIKLKAFL